jgi:hypothetical protein
MIGKLDHSVSDSSLGDLIDLSYNHKGVFVNFISTK